MKGMILADGKKFSFSNLFQVAIQTEDQLWVLDGTPKAMVLKFRPASGEVTSKLASGKWTGGGTREYLKRWRKLKGCTQERAAEILQVSPSLIAKIEAGQRKMPVAMFYRIRKDFGGGTQPPKDTKGF